MREKEKAMTHDELMIIKKNEHEKSKKEQSFLMNRDRKRSFWILNLNKIEKLFKLRKRKLKRLFKFLKMT